METTTGFIGRFGTTAMRLVGALAMALLLMGAVAHHAGATDMDKGAFKSGCESGGGSFVDSADGSFQCNLKSGGTIKCQNTSSPCTYTATLGGGGKVSVVNVAATAGHLQVAPVSTPAPTRVAIGGLSKANVAKSSAP
jgi:hypothetical protein